MKHLIYLLSFTIILLVFACHKDSIAVKSSVKTAATLPGKWKLIGTMLSAGGPQYFVPDNNKDYVTFNTDGTLEGTAFSGYKYFTVKDSITIHMTTADKASYEDYRYTIKYDTLKMGPAGPSVCIEGCSVILVKD
jgi:hypothetical protein